MARYLIKPVVTKLFGARIGIDNLFYAPPGVAHIGRGKSTLVGVTKEPMIERIVDQEWISCLRVAGVSAVVIAGAALCSGVVNLSRLPAAVAINKLAVNIARPTHRWAR